ncbi:uroporphyrinogen-III C-methyltransferase [Thiohalorhabdus methylotrophus]|uniref:Uroporphyrinogen-III C-methyltransferase n=1 Tax=Thiohalorhabdus methylotrophus TaxID=3242694 RepID=A0ABV4TT97_9GAMM
MADSNEQPGSDATSGPERMGESLQDNERPESEGAASTGEQGEEQGEAGGDNGGQRPPSNDKGGGRGGLLLGGLALFVALGAGGAGAYFYLQLDRRVEDFATTLANREQQQERLRQELSQDLDQMVRELRSTLEQNSQAQSQLTQRQEELRNRIEQMTQSLQTLRGATQDLQAQLEGGPTYWRLERIETLLVSAERIAQLEEDPEAAYAALKSADQALRDLNAPGWMEVRRSIQSSMTKLEQANNPDLAGIAFKLSSLAESAMDLPVKGVSPPPLGDQEQQAAREEQAEPRGWWGQFVAGLNAFWQDVKSLVRLRRSGKEMEPLLPPDKATFLRHNLVLNLQTARLAALQQRDELYHRSLRESRDWVQRFFDTDSSAVQAFLSSLKSLGDRNITQDLPPVDAPLTTFRQVRKERSE